MAELKDVSCRGKCEQGVCGGWGDWGGPCGGCCSCLGGCFKQQEHEQHAQYVEDMMSCPVVGGSAGCGAPMACISGSPACKETAPPEGWAAVLKELKGSD